MEIYTERNDGIGQHAHAKAERSIFQENTHIVPNTYTLLHEHWQPRLMKDSGEIAYVSD